MAQPDDDEEVPEAAARGVIRGWILAKTMPLLIKLGAWLVLFVGFAAGGALAGWRARRAIVKGALDGQRESEREPLPSEVVRARGLIAWIKGEGP
jgi:anti-sigma factor RsiW